MRTGESIYNGRDMSAASRAESWCRFSAGCYKAGMPMHRCVPQHGQPYMDGCCRDEDTCASAQLALGNADGYRHATQEDRRQMDATAGWGVCKMCGVWFEKGHKLERYCSDECRRKAATEKKARYRERNRERYREYQKEWSEKHREERREYQREWHRRQRGESA